MKTFDIILTNLHNPTQTYTERVQAMDKKAAAEMAARIVGEAKAAGHMAKITEIKVDINEV